ncbi:hypothetical protein [Planktotalea sp.]|uniref:hypothetical protein n=1 Tax=Planktotalea sp. TaxID=2029877 RepID=UPI0025DAD46B|nr:hypothetical protein [Planktotalea sp.]
MVSVNWFVFREVYFKIVISILAVIASMLLLQSSLNNLKLRSLVAEATSSKLQITASTIESAIVRAEGLGLAMDEMAGLQDLLDRERARDASIVRIEVVSPIGAPIVVSGTIATDANDPKQVERLASEREQAFRRVLGARDKVTLFDAGPHLYTGRILYDSSDAVMGAIVLTTPTRQYLSRANRSLKNMTNAYLAIFALVAVLLVPFIIFQFSGVRHAYRALDPDLIGTVTKISDLPEAAQDIVSTIEAGQSAFSIASAELDQYLEPHTDEHKSDKAGEPS